MAMKKTNPFFYCLGQGILSIGRNKVFSLVSIATVAACIFLIGIFMAAILNMNHIVDQAQETVCITVFFDEDLSEEQILDANTSEVVMDLLESKTFNDENLYTDLTAAEILEELELKRNIELNDKTDRLFRVESNSWKRSRTIATILYSVLWVGMVILFLFLKFIDYSSWKGWNILFNILSVLPALWGLLSWGGWIWPKANVINGIANKVYNMLYKDLDSGV